MPTLSQAQNEALVRLLIAARYQDKKLSALEQEDFDKHLEQLNWQGHADAGTFALRESSNVRKLLADANGLAAFIELQVVTFKTPEEKEQCLKSLAELLASDQLADSENTFLQQVEAALKR